MIPASPHITQKISSNFYGTSIQARNNPAVPSCLRAPALYSAPWTGEKSMVDIRPSEGGEEFPFPRTLMRIRAEPYPEVPGLRAW